MPELPPDDPITNRPMAGLVLISMFVLMLTVAWSLYDEFYGLRPWRKYQGEFSSAYSSYLDKEYKLRKADEQKFYSTPEYQKLMADVKAATDAARPMDRQIGEQIDLLDRQRAAMTDAFTNSRGLVGSLTYQLEQIDEKDKSAKDSKLKDLNEAKAQTYPVAWPVEGGKIEQDQFNYEKLNGLFVSIMQSKAKLVAQRGDIDQPAKDAQDKLNAYVKEQLPGLASKDLFTLSQSMKSMDVHIRQINVNPTGTSINNLGGAGLVGEQRQFAHGLAATDFAKYGALAAIFGVGAQAAGQQEIDLVASVALPEQQLARLQIGEFGFGPDGFDQMLVVGMKMTFQDCAQKLVFMTVAPIQPQHAAAPLTGNQALPNHVGICTTPR